MAPIWDTTGGHPRPGGYHRGPPRRRPERRDRPLSLPHPARRAEHRYERTDLHCPVWQGCTHHWTGLRGRRVFDPDARYALEVGAVAKVACTFVRLADGPFPPCAPRGDFPAAARLLPVCPNHGDPARPRASPGDAAQLQSGCAHFRRGYANERGRGPAPLYRVVPTAVPPRQSAALLELVRAANQRRRG